MILAVNFTSYGPCILDVTTNPQSMMAIWNNVKTVLGILLKVSGRSFQAFDVNHGEEESESSQLILKESFE